MSCRAVQHFVSWCLISDFRVNTGDQVCFTAVPSEVKQDLFCMVQLLLSEGSGTPLGPWSLVMVLPLLCEPSTQESLPKA